MSRSITLRKTFSRRAAERRCLTGAPGAFTLVEILVSLSILGLVMVVLVSMVDSTSSVWRHTVAKAEQFREARDGFEAITRRLSQATLNTYWDYHFPNNDTTKPPDKYMRQSELRFISGPSLAGSGSSSPPRPTHSIFFQAPLGFVMPSSASDTTAKNYYGMENLLNTWGYYIEYNTDAAVRPPFVTSSSRNRFRLMELMESSQSLKLYSLEAAAGGNANYKGIDWFLDSIYTPPPQTPPVHVLAENVIALIVLPKLPPAAQVAGKYTDSSLAPNYLYDSTGTGMTTLTDPKLDPTNQLPPIVQITMIAIDEASASRLSDIDNQAIISEFDGLFTNATQYAADLGGDPQATASEGLTPFLIKMRINFRVFTTEVAIKGAKWSTN